MSNLLDALSSVFNFLFTQMGNIASFFTSNLLGQIILGIIIFTIVIELIMIVIAKIKG